jgi:nucleoside-diphosphate-sugar epimerase
MNTISILGCGWLGKPLAVAFLAKNMKVKGSTTTQEKIQTLENSGIKAFQIAFQPEFKGDPAFFESELLVINIPPKAKALGEEYHLTQVVNILKECEKSKKIQKIIFVSSTSVYPNIEKEMKEKDADSNHFLVKAENLLIDFSKKYKKDFLIVRFGGLMGMDRNPCKYFTSETASDFTKVNYIHQNDAVGSILSLIDENIVNATFNIVSPMHPTRAEIWENCSQKQAQILTKTRNSSKKTINTDSFFSKSNYQFQFPDPLAFKYL